MRTIFLYGLAMALLVFLLKWLEYRYIVRDLSLEFYLGIIAISFSALGVWAGLRLTRKKANHVSEPVAFVTPDELLRQTGISKREYEVLQLMAQGLSNQEIADKLYISLNTVKTHSSNLFVKLDVKRRTQAIQRAKDLALIP
jgi:DNA-binding NarL/FixJ family response regulator